jgi:hypothetical protein
MDKQIAGECRICKAKPGEECIDPATGKPLGGVHAFGSRRPIEHDFRTLTRNEEVDK